MDTQQISVIGGPLHGKTLGWSGGGSFKHREYTSGGEVVHVYTLEKYANQHRAAYFWVHPDTTDAQMDHALGLADI